MDKKIFVKMFADLCCSNCHCDFTENSINILRNEDNLYVLEIICEHCNKSFGVAMLTVNSDKNSDNNYKTKSFSDNDLKLEIDEILEPISYDDVLDAHNCIKNFDENWQKFLDEKFLQ